MAHGFADSPSITFRSLASAVMPWLFSSTVHMSVVLVMAVSLSWSQTPRGAGGDTLQVTILASGEGTGAGEGGTAISSQLGSSDIGYYDDERPTLEAEPSAASQSGGGSGTNAALASLLSEQPALRSTGTLPAGGPTGSNDAAGGGSGDGNGPGEGIGSANRLASAARAGHGFARRHRQHRRVWPARRRQ